MISLKSDRFGRTGSRSGAHRQRAPESLLRIFVADLQRGFAFSPAVDRQLEAVWQLVLSDDGGWEGALGELAAAGADLLEAKPSGLGQMVKGGALGYAGAALLGPVGWLGAAAALYFDGEAKDKQFQRAAGRWESAVQRFGESTDRWAERAAHHLEGFLLEVVAEVRGYVLAASDPEEAALPILQMLADLEDDADQEGASQTQALPRPDGPNGCPSCGRTYPQSASWCDVCEVGL